MIGKDGRDYTSTDAKNAESRGDYEKAFEIYKLGWDNHGLELAIRINDSNRFKEFYDEGLTIMMLESEYLRALEIAKNNGDTKRLKEIYNAGLNHFSNISYFNEAIKLVEFMGDDPKRETLYQKAEDEANLRLSSYEKQLKKMLMKVGVWTKIRDACRERSNVLDDLLKIENKI